MKAERTFFVCSECEYRAPKWLGRCPSCGAWNTLEEVRETASESENVIKRASPSKATELKKLEIPTYMRKGTGMSELDRVLGGGVVEGSVVLIAGEPGIGKSTLLMQVCSVLAKSGRVLYVSGEESGGQLKYRAERLKVAADDLYILTETDVERVIEECRRLSPAFVMIDSVQTMYCKEISSSAGSVTQVRESAMRFISLAKSGEGGISVFLVGHVNKEGSIAGPKVLEHMVDAVLSFEGDREQSYRIIRASKNRYGSTNEIGVFEMTGEGLCEVPNPSETLLAGRPQNMSGNCAVCVMEGSRPLITEIQALVGKSVFPSPKRASNGVDYNRMYLILAVLEKRLGLRFSTCDAYLNVIGGIRFEEPAADLAISLSLISSIRDIPIPGDVIAFGEIGLSGEIRAVGSPDQRVNEAARLGFRRIVLPKRNYEAIKNIYSKARDIELIPVKSIFDAMKILSAESADKDNN